MAIDREALISDLFESMSIAKRSMQGKLHLLTGDSPISRTQLELLFTLKQLQPASPKKIAAHMHLTPGAISQHVDHLVENDFISREADLYDRRTQILKLSRHGMIRLRTIEKNRRQLMESVMKSLTDSELTLLLQVQKKMTEEFQKLQPTEITKGDKE